MNDIWSWLRSQELALAGAAGATVVALTEWSGWVAFIRHFVVGMLTATYAYEFGLALASPAFTMLQLSEDRRAPAGAFLTGAIAIVLVQFILEFVRAARRQIGKGDKT